MTTTPDVAVKHATSLRTHRPPATAHLRGTPYLSWVDAQSGSVWVAEMGDGGVVNGVDLGVRSSIGTALAADGSGLVLVWVDAESGEIRMARSPDGVGWTRTVPTGVRASSTPRAAVHGERLWLVVAQYRRGGFDVLSSADGRQWVVEQSLDADGLTAANLVVLEGALNVVWVDGRRGSVWAAPVGGAERSRATELYEGPVAEPSLLTLDDTVHLAWFDEDTDQIHVLERRRRGGWRERTVLHERSRGAPAVFVRNGVVGVAWTRDDGSQAIHVEGDVGSAVIEATRVFHGDVIGHPTALSSEHHTPYPYLGVVVLPSDFSLPKGKTANDLVQALDSTLDEVSEFWQEASFGGVEITHTVHPSVVTLPSPMNTYLVRARPKLIEGHGAAPTIPFPPAATLDLAAEGGFSVQITFPNAVQTLDEVVQVINTVIDGANYAGPADSKPVATRNENSQLRIRTAGFVDPGDALAVTGGTALALLGLDTANRTVYEGSTKEVNHLELMLRDALSAVAQPEADPAAFLKQHYGVAVSIASDVGWYLLRAEASMGPDEISLLGQNVTLAHYFVTSMDANETHAHEVGHNLALPDQYEEGSRNVGAELWLWDVMDKEAHSHPSAWVKAYRSSPALPDARWVKDAAIATLDGPNQSVEVLLAPLESALPTANPFSQSHPGVPLRHGVKIVIADGHAYYVENRQHGPYSHPHLGDVQFSQRLPGDGIIITDCIDDVAALSFSRVPAVMVHPYGLDVGQVPPSAVDQIMAAETVAAKQAIIDAYVPAEIPQSVADQVAGAAKREVVEQILRSYRDSQIRAFYPVNTLGEEVVIHQFADGGNIRVEVVEVIGSARPYVYLVRVSWGRKGSSFDLEIRKWQNPPPYQSEDIWIDSEENGWGVYEHSDPVTNPGVLGSPVLNGDRPWVGHDNRVMARVWNRGDIAQHNVRVDFLEVVPPGQANGYAFDTDFIDIPAGGFAIATGIWRPKKVPAHEHGCVAVQVEYRPANLALNVIGEDNANNNTAQENIDDFYVSKSSPYSAIELPFEFASPLPDSCEMKVHAQGLEPGWTLSVEPYRFRLQPGERMQGRLVLRADDGVPLTNHEEGHAAPTISVEAMVRIGCTWERVGGFSMVAHTVRRSALDVAVDPAGGGAWVSLHAHDAVGPIVGANVAIRLMLDAESTVAVTRGRTDAQGEITTFVPVDWSRFGPPATLALDVRLTPTGQSGPATAHVPLARP